MRRRRLDMQADRIEIVLASHKVPGRGDFLLVAKGDVVRFQAAYAGEADIAQLVQGIRGGGTRDRDRRAPELQARSESP